MKEIWKDINCMNIKENVYEASNFGRIRNKKTNKILKSWTSNEGYCYISLKKKNNKYSITKLSRIIAMTYLKKPYNKNEVNHKDENKQNNKVGNLEWCDRQYNNNYGTRNERVSKKLSKKVNQYDKNGRLLKTWDSIQEIIDTLHCRNISQCCRGIRKTVHGYIWKYKEDL